MNNSSCILIVDDNPDNLKVLSIILKGEGYKTALALDATEALHTLENNSIDLILLDIMMPNIDGYELCNTIKSNVKYADLPIIFISALIGTDDIVKALNAGGVDYITKPFQTEEVKARVATQMKISKQTQELKELNAAKNKFFSIIAHDLRSPFTSIVGFSYLLEERIDELDKDTIKQYTSIIQNSSKQAVDLLSNLSEWSRTQTDKVSFNPQQLELKNIFENVIAFLSDNAKQKSIVVLYELDEVQNIYADPDMLSIILRNLVSNAIKFTHPGGRITITASLLQKGVRIAVSDNGVGIKEENLGKLFRIDENLSTKGTQEEEGTGLGLILCKEFVEKHLGTIGVESTPGEGSTFYFTIPKMKSV